MYLNILTKKQLALFKKLGFLKKYGFYLAGGTALALQINHRTSVDFDFYAEKKFNSRQLHQLLEKKFNEVILLHKAEGTLNIKIDGVTVSFFQYPYPLISSPVKYQNFPPLASKKDIGAMKIIAISDRGTKRDFIDIYFLLREISLKEIFEAAQKKYPNFNVYVGIRALTYFDDAERVQKRRLYLFEFVSWAKVKEFFIEEIKKYQKKWLN